MAKSTHPKFTPERVEELKKDFVEYSGGYTPDEAFDEMETYTRINCPDWCEEMELWDWFQSWTEECEKLNEN